LAEKHAVNPDNLTFGLAFLAGLASFLSPCVLALVPAYIGYLGGMAINPSGAVIENRWVTFGHGIAFILGFSIVFIILGAAASVIGVVFYEIRDLLAKAGGIVLVIFGMHTMGVINIPILNYDTRRRFDPTESLGFMSSLAMGVFFSAGWAPCVGPVLGAVLTLALNGADIQQGVLLLTAYSMGLAIPFMFAALGIGRAAELMQRYSRAVKTISVATGVIMVIVGVLLFMGTLEQLAQFGFFVDFGL
jgi:cytochrome c-type biogenesis protein